MGEEQHPMRCETCEHDVRAGCAHNHYCMKKEYGKESAVGLGTRLLNATVEHIREFGCASHSSATAPDEWPNNIINPIEGDSRGYRCIHCDVSGDAQFCHYHKAQIVSLPFHDAAIIANAKQEERERVLGEIIRIAKTGECIHPVEGNCDGDRDCTECIAESLRGGSG